MTCSVGTALWSLHARTRRKKNSLPGLYLTGDLSHHVLWSGIALKILSRLLDIRRKPFFLFGTSNNIWTFGHIRTNLPYELKHFEKIKTYEEKNNCICTVPHHSLWKRKSLQCSLVHHLQPSQPYIVCTYQVSEQLFVQVEAEVAMLLMRFPFLWWWRGCKP